MRGFYAVVDVQGHTTTLCSLFAPFYANYKGKPKSMWGFVGGREGGRERSSCLSQRKE